MKLLIAKGSGNSGSNWRKCDGRSKLEHTCTLRGISVLIYSAMNPLCTWAENRWSSSLPLPKERIHFRLLNFCLHSTYNTFTSISSSLCLKFIELPCISSAVSRHNKAFFPHILQTRVMHYSIFRVSSHICALLIYVVSIEWALKYVQEGCNSADANINTTLIIQSTLLYNILYVNCDICIFSISE